MADFTITVHERCGTYTAENAIMFSNAYSLVSSDPAICPVIDAGNGHLGYAGGSDPLVGGVVTLTATRLADGHVKSHTVEVVADAPPPPLPEFDWHQAGVVPK